MTRVTKSSLRFIARMFLTFSIDPLLARETLWGGVVGSEAETARYPKEGARRAKRVDREGAVRVV